ISWEQAEAFIDSLNAQTGYGYRLPTEAEWEFAARGGNLSDGYKYAGGDSANLVGWNLGNSFGKTYPVGQKLPNELGIYDMSGNVAEWVADWYDATYYGTSSGLNPTGPGMGTQRVVRGGSWFHPEDSLRVSDRSSQLPSFRNNRIGLRLVRPVNLATVLTDSISMVTDSSAVSGGDVISDGGSAVTERGLVWDTATAPTVDDDKDVDGGSGLGTYTSALDSLDPGVTYYVRAYAINANGTSYGRAFSFTTPAILPTVQTDTVTMVTDSSATGGGGRVLTTGGAAVTARGLVWSRGTMPTIDSLKSTDGTGLGPFSSVIDSLIPLTTYYYRAYATNSVGTAYGSEYSFMTPAGAPEILTDSITGITDSSLVAHINVYFDGGDSVTVRGVAWGTSPNPTTAGDTTINGSDEGIFSVTIDSLSPGTTYYIRGYAINSIGTGYGNQLVVTTDTILPVVTTDSLSVLSGTEATGGGIVVSDGGALVTARGVVWDTLTAPTLADEFSVNGTGGGAFVSVLDSLQPFTTYYMRAYATNNVGTAYGNEISFTTPALLPTIVTDTITGITDSIATSGGMILSDGGASITAYGVVWGRGSSPTIDSSKTVDGSGIASFTSQLTNLLPVTTYYVRAYATNSAGTGYGNEYSFTTLAGTPRVTTTTVTNITDTTAVTGGTVIADGGTPVTERGIVWGSRPNPTLDSMKIIVGSGTGSFVANLTGLELGRRYYVRAYATNSSGTAYGEQVSFSTSEFVSMVLVEAGTFNMGCTGEQTSCDPDESPVRTITLDSFYIGQYEVTQAEWEDMMGSNPSNNMGCDECPVERVSWDDVQEFIDSLNAFTGLNYRLPTEAEWEFAARGGNASLGYQYAGSNTVDSVAWYASNSSSTTHPVGQKRPNELDLYDMSGNVYEWVNDRYSDTSYLVPGIINPTGIATGA
ncbi:MAG: SUMF1/EgtB/PvdO family nonheme iron enzyme, partial [Saprospiraceae bacterium]|nr:SUMF1/EgtB/PvdO family nonheme iron enzyme [Saprospiraceae bacterium]